MKSIQKRKPNVNRKKSGSGSVSIFSYIPPGFEIYSSLRFPYQKWKRENMRLAKIYEQGETQGLIINSGRLKSERLKDCSRFIVVDATTGRAVFGRDAEYINVRGRKTKVRMWLCKTRLCPVCGYWRARRLGKKVYRIISALKEEKRKLAYSLLTLTSKNCSIDELDETLDKIMEAWNRLTTYAAWKRAIEGYIRALEITYNEKEKSFHIHLHLLLAVDAVSYFTKDSSIYLSQRDFQAMWKKALRVDYDPIVDIRRTKGNTAKVVSEIVKYTVKPEDYIKDGDIAFSMEAIVALDRLLHKRRAFSLGGIFNKKAKELSEQIETEDSEEAEEVELEPIPEARLRAYFFHNGFYIRRKEENGGNANNTSTNNTS